MSQKIVKSIANSILLNEYPKSQIDIFIMVLHHDGSVLSAAINAAVVALCDSGILMKDLPMAASVLVGDSDIFLDPTASEEAVFHSKTYEDNYGIITATHMTSFDELSLITQDGRITGKIAARAIKVAIEDG
jgi:exosome complex component RRP41